MMILIICFSCFLRTLPAYTGYGDIVPINTSERIVACIAFIVGASVFGYVTANIVDTVGAFGRGEQVTNFSVRSVMYSHSFNPVFFNHFNYHLIHIQPQP